MGYGSNWWSTGEDNGGFQSVVVFRGNQVLRGTSGGAPSGQQRVLLVGLGGNLWYGRNPQWREMPSLLTAAEGFWRTTAGCRDL